MPDDLGAPLESLLLIENAGQWAKTAGRELQTVAPGAIQGALKGFMIGGPAGAALGAVAGGAGARLRSPTHAATPSANLTAANQSGAVANPAALQLLAALLRPEVIQALGAMSLGAAGVPQVPVAGQQVPIAAFANLLSTMAGQIPRPRRRSKIVSGRSVATTIRIHRRASAAVKASSSTATKNPVAR